MGFKGYFAQQRSGAIEFRVGSRTTDLRCLHDRILAAVSASTLRDLNGTGATTRASQAYVVRKTCCGEFRHEHGTCD